MTEYESICCEKLHTAMIDYFNGKSVTAISKLEAKIALEALKKEYGNKQDWTELQKTQFKWQLNLQSSI